MAVAHRAGLAGLQQPLLGVLAQRLQQAVALLGPARLGQHQRLVHQPREQVQHLPRRHRVARVAGAARPHGLGRLQGEAARRAPGEDGQAPEQGPLRLGEEVVAPVDGRLEGLLPAQGGAPAPGQQAEPVTQARRELLRGQHPHPGRRQLQGQGDPV